MQKLIRVFGIIILFVLILLIPGILIVRGILKQSVPDYSGEITETGISHKTTVWFDSLGIPYISAMQEDDAAFALGYLHAQERLFQMDLGRRAGLGRLSEVFGEKTLNYDILFRSVGINRVAQEILNKISPETKRMLEAYTGGVNKYLTDHKDNLPLEFDILGYIPEEWKPLHSIVIIRMMAWELNIAWWQDVSLTRVVEKAGAIKAEEIIPYFPDEAPRMLSGKMPATSKENFAFFDVLRSYKDFMNSRGSQVGSNNWVVSPSKSTSGFVILASDPHLTLQQPGRWYLAVIKGGTLNVAGVTLAGVPGVVIGHNDSIAWGLTNVMADDADFYALKLTNDRKSYVVDNDTLPFTVIETDISVKDQEKFIHKVYLSQFGPLLSGYHPHNNDNQSGMYSTEIAMQWTGMNPSDEYYAFYMINKAKGLNEFKAAVSHFKVPGQNFVYGDNKGNISYFCGAGIPERGEGDPRMILDGSTMKTKWKGMIPFSAMPSMVNPTSGYIATSNNQTAVTPYYISSLWEPSSRIERITSLLNSKEKHSSSDFMKYQSDQLSFYAGRITPYILSAFQNIKVNDVNLREALELLKHWNYTFDALSQTPAIYSVFLTKFYENILEDELSEELLNDYSRIANVPLKILYKLIQNPDAAVFDDVATVKKENRDDIIRQSLSDALTYLEKRFGQKVALWQWGELHKLTLKHFFSGNNSLLDNLINDGPYGVGGDGTTLNLSEYPFYKYDEKGKTDDFENSVGPSMRFIYDFASPTQFYFSTTGGQSGNILSDHYKDMTAHWLEGKYITVKTSEEVFSQNNKVIYFIP